MNRLILTYIILGMIWTAPGTAAGQTCSCAGAPLISSQSISSASAGNLLVGVSYEYNNIDDLYSGSTELNNQSVRRNTQSTLLEANYGLTEQLTLSGTFSYVRKERITGLQTNRDANILTTTGLGDGLVMLKYVIHQNTIRSQYQLALGAGVKVPFGTTSLSQNGLQLNADMQPGTGAWDGVLWSYFSKTFAPHSTINWFWFNTYRRTGTNDRFGQNDRYKFGNELVSTVGVTNKLAGDLSYILMARYRSTRSDQRNEVEMHNTGGRWVSAVPALSYPLSNQLSIRISGRIPVYQHLEGTQPTTSYTLSASVFYNFSNRIIF